TPTTVIFTLSLHDALPILVIGLIFIYLAIKYEYEPLLLIPIGTGILIGNIPFFTDGGTNLQVGIYQQGSVLNYLYFGVLKGVYRSEEHTSELQSRENLVCR